MFVEIPVDVPQLVHLLLGWDGALLKLDGALAFHDLVQDSVGISSLLLQKIGLEPLLVPFLLILFAHHS